MRIIFEIVRYSGCSPQARVLCRKLSLQFEVRQSRIYSLLHGSTAKNSTEMKVLDSMRKMGFIKEVRFRYR